MRVPSVFSGSLSFVGPNENNNKKSFYLGKKGLTGLWYTDTDGNRESERQNIFYAKNQNIWLDLEILGKTLMKMWRK